MARQRMWASLGASLGMTTLVVLSAAMAAQNIGAERAQQPEVPAVLQLTGSYSAIEAGRIELIADEARWEAVWKEHKGKGIEKNANGFETWPIVDFDRYSVLCVFGGKGTNTNGWRLVSLADMGTHTRVRYDALRFQTASFDGSDSRVATTAFGLFVIPRPDRELVLEQDVNSMIGAPPKWKETMRIPPPGGAPTTPTTPTTPQPGSPPETPTPPTKPWQPLPGTPGSVPPSQPPRVPQPPTPPLPR